MRLRRNGSAPYLSFPLLDRFPELRHGIFTREGGVSLPPVETLNVGRSVGDDPRNVARNREIVSETLGGLPLAYVHQVHGTGVRIIRASDHDPFELPKADAIVTDRPGLLLAIQVADCQPVLLYDPVRKVVGNVHSGWRGSVENVIGRTVSEMAGRFGTDPADIRAGIGPSLGPCCAEFVHYTREIPESLWGYRVGECHFDFWRMSRDQLVAAGVRPEHVAQSYFCTRCNPHLFYSYRQSHRTGRFTGVIGLA